MCQMYKHNTIITQTHKHTHGLTFIAWTLELILLENCLKNGNVLHLDIESWTRQTNI